MKTYTRVLLLAICAFLVAAAQAGEARLKIEYAGVVYDSVDLTTLMDTIIISDAAAKGSFGAMDAKVVSKFSPFEPLPGYAPPCESPKIPVGMLYARSVTTFKDHSQLFVYFDSGWLCVTPGVLSGEASYDGGGKGRIIGGTGRFAGATGEIDTEFGGVDLAGQFVGEGPAFPAFGSWSGVLTGTIDF
jgi:hypothetical protein